MRLTTIKSKLMIAFFSIASLVVIVGIIGILNSLHVNTALNSVANDPLPELLLAYNIQTAVNRISSDVVGFAMVSPMTTQLHQERLHQIMQDNIINQRIRIENTEIKKENAKASESIRIQQQEILFSSIGAFLMSLIIGRHISLNSIIKPLLRLKQATIQVAHGDFGFVEQKNTSQTDEIGELSIHFDNMRQTLNQRTMELESSNKQLSLANEQLKVHHRMQRDFINIAAHELRTPIEPLLLGSEQLKYMLPNDEIVSIVLRNARKLQTLSNTILDASRIEGGTFKLYKERANIKDIILEVLDLTTYSTCNKDDDKLKILFEPKDIFIDADKDRIVQVVSNILNNAVKFVKEKEGGGGGDDRGEEERQITIITQI